MATSSSRVPVEGSERGPVPGATKTDGFDPARPMTVSVYIRPARPLEEAPSAGAQPMTREEYASAFGADPADLALVQAFATGHDLTVEQVDQARRVVVLRGTAAQMAAAFGVELSLYDHPDDGIYRGREGAVTVPADLGGVITSVHGLDDRPQARPHRQMAEGVAPSATGASFSPVEVAALYHFPSDSMGEGQCVAVIELGGGYTAADLQQFFAGVGVTEPEIMAVGVDGGANSPDPKGDADVEVALDIEVIGAVAPGAKMAVYFAPNTDQGFLDAVTTAVHDTTYKPSIISISWGGPESSWSQQSLQAFDQAFQAAGLLGVTVCVAAGDNGSRDGVTSDTHAHVDFPASSPNVLACGGTRLAGTGETIGSEVVWNSKGGSTGGGISDVFPLPAYQQGAGVPLSANRGKRVGRGVPDVAGDADPDTGYQIVVHGGAMTIGGTSAVAPLWAGLIARVNSARKTPAGQINARLYAHPGAMHDITTGTNGAYRAQAGWDPCTGLGSPDGTLVQQALTP